MSYILDALKKSEQERSDSGVDNVRPLHHFYAPGPASRVVPERRWLWLFLSALVFSIGISAGAWFYYQASVKNAAPMVTKEQPDVALITQPSTVATPPPIVAEFTDLPPETKPEIPQVAPEPSPAHESIQPVDAQDMEDKPITKPEPVRPVVEIAELPADIRRRLPVISFSGHVFSSNIDARSVVINGRKLHQGQSVNKDLMVEEITRFGAVFRISNYRFRLGALQDWRNE